MESYEVVKADVLVIGGGGAGLRSAIEAREVGADVLLVSKSRIGRGNNTAVAGSAMAAATGWYHPEDSPEVHYRDTIEVGRHLNDRSLVIAMTKGAKQQVYDLERFGVEFAKDGDRYFVLDVPSHTYPRVVKPRQGIGTGLTLPLSRHAAAIGVRAMEGIFITTLLQNNGDVIGALGIDGDGKALVFHAKAVVIASGGLCRIFERTTNVPGASGDGYVLAYEAGAKLKDMEFIQFLPATLKSNTKRLFLYEAFIESGASFRNSLGQDVALSHGLTSPRQMTRDRVARALMIEILEGRGIDGSVLLDFSGISKSRWEELARVRSRSTSLRNLRREAYQVAPSAHFAMGGIQINERCETGIDGLIAAGEVCGGVHGANRLGPNAITEIFVFGKIAGLTAAQRAADAAWKPLGRSGIQSELRTVRKVLSQAGSEELPRIRTTLGNIMWQRGGIIRSAQGMDSAMSDLLQEKKKLPYARIATPKDFWNFLEVRNAFVVAEMILTSARLRTESRGSHFRTDYPEEDGNWVKNIVLYDSERKLHVELHSLESPCQSPGHCRG